MAKNLAKTGVISRGIYTPVYIENEKLRLNVKKLDSANPYNLTFELIEKDGKFKHNFEFSLGWYKTFQASKISNRKEHSSGYYAFSTTDNTTRPFVTIERVFRQATPEFDMIFIELASVYWRSTAGFIKVYLEPEGAENFVRFEIAMPDILPWTNKKERFGYELVAFWQSLDIKNDEYFTDSNGLELLTRTPQKGIDKQDIPASFSPVTSMIGIRDEHRSLTVLTDRALGGTGFTPGRIELLINRKT